MPAARSMAFWRHHKSSWKALKKKTAQLWRVLRGISALAARSKLMPVQKKAHAEMSQLGKTKL
jgi:hypothetical protein